MKKLLTLIVWTALAGGAAWAQEVTNLNHTIVRFAVNTDGTNVGTLDLELFDQEKPETVQNFLLYVQSGSYSNLVLHRLVPNFILQGGHIRIADPTSTNSFESYLPKISFGPTTNEYSVGPELLNVYGTIAMARIPGQTNSASADWFINLKDNPNLDTIDGGFTVFGRVVNTSGPLTGTNVLNFFNTFNATNDTNGISGTFIPEFAEQLTEIPVSIPHDFSLSFFELFTVNAAVVQQAGPARETNAPTLTVLDPSEAGDVDLTTSNLSVTISGTANDDTGVARVYYDTPRGRFTADGRTNWSARVRLNLGTNVIKFFAVDRFGNLSTEVQRTVVSVATPAVTIVDPPEAGDVDLYTNRFTIQFSGTANPENKPARIVLDTERGRITGTGTTNWTAEVQLRPGTNTITAYAVDDVGLFSAGVTRTVVYAAVRPVTLRIEGKGRVSGLTNGQMFAVGSQVTVTGTPARGYYFNGWRGDVFSHNRTFTFTVGEDTEVVLRCPRTLLGLETGRYEGVFYPATNGPAKSTGLITLTLRRNGLYSGRIKPVGATYYMRGQLNANGFSVIGCLDCRTAPLQLLLTLSTEGSEALEGYYTDGRFYSPLALYRVQKYGRTNPTTLAGTYTFNLTPPPTNSLVADGSGFGSATVSTAGRVTLSGVLADGAPFKQTVSLGKSGLFPIYYWKKKGDAVVGIGVILTNGTINGFARWFGPHFPGATNTTTTLRGFHYTPPSQARLFDWTNGVVTLSGDGLPAPITSDVLLHEDGSFTVLSNTHNLQLVLTNDTGWLGGSFTHPGSNLTTRVRGAVLQSSNSAAGFFPGTPRNGAFEIRRAP